MNSLRRWLYRPKRSDPSLLAQFYFADEELNLVAAELDSFEGRKDPERCTALVNQLRACQARVLNVVSQMMDECVKDQRAPRDFRVKFPDDVIQDNLAGQLWFGAECLAAGSSIMNREIESACMRPLARALTKNLDSLRSILREQCLRNVHEYSEMIKESLVIFDKLFAEFELSYVSAMVPVKTAHEYDMVQEITVLFSETVQRALTTGLLTTDMIDEYDPALMFTIPRLAIVSGVIIFNDGPLNPDNDPWNISEMFRPFQTLLLKIRELLGILTEEELNTLERALCSQEEPSFLISLEEKKKQNAREERRKSKEEKKPKTAPRKDKNKKHESEGDDGSVESELTALEIAERLEALALNFEASRNTKHPQTGAQPDADAESKSSESSSTSSSSLLSEAETDDGTAEEVPKESASDHPGETQVQRFTNQLYYEANLDSHDMTQEAALIGPLNAFSSETIFITPQVPNTASDSNAEGDTSENEALSDRACAQGKNEEDAKYEDAAEGRAHFAMNKCDSNDSGLHSEVISNSGSMFTISSSDSNHLLGSLDAPATSENVESSLNPSVTLATESPKEYDHLDSRDSTSTLVPSSELSGNERGCLESCSAGVEEQDCDERGAGAANNGDDDIMVSPMEEQAKLVDSVNNIKPCDTPCGTESSNCLSSQAAAASASPEICQTDFSCKFTDCGTSPSLTTDHNCCEGCPKENIDSSPNKATVNKCDLEKTEEGSSPFVNASAGENLTSDDKAKQDCLSTGSDIRSCTVPKELAHSSQHDKSKVEHSQCDICDNNVPKDKKGGDSLNETDINNAAKAEDSVVEPQTGAMSIASTSAEEEPQTRSEETGYVEILDNSLHSKEVRTGDNDKPAELKATSVCEENDPSLTNRSEDLAKSSDSEKKIVSDSPVLSTNAISAAQSVATANSCPSTPPSTNMQTEPQEKSKLTSTQREMPNHSSMPIASSSSQASSSATAARACLKDTKGASSKVSSRKSSKVKSSQPERHHAGDTRSSMPSRAKALMDSHLMDSEYCNSSETSSYNSDCGDQEEIALAIKAAESATRHQVRARFRSSSDMIHRLFVCISGVADQLQTNFAGDLRNILRAVFDMNCSEPIDINDNDKSKDTTPLRAAYRAMSNASRSARRARHSPNQRQDPPSWVPDEQSNECMSCQVPFTFVRRRHHCRNCGKIFCSRCSSNFVPLPHFGQERAVRVCNRCFMFKVTPFTVRPRPQ